MSMPKIPKAPTGTKMFGQYPDKSPMIGVNPRAYEDLIRGHGIRMVQTKPIPCPSQKTLNGGDHDPACQRCHNGFIYYGETEFVGVFMGNSLQKNFGMNGVWDYDNATVILPAKDASGNEMDFNYFDQIRIPGKTVRYYQRVEASQTGVDRLHFPAVSVELLLDSSGLQYVEGVDFQIGDTGYIEWIGSRRPGYDLSIDSGHIYSIVYFTEPVFTIISLPHQIRSTQAMDESGTAVEERYPQLAGVRRDFIPNQTGDGVGRADVAEPRDGSI